MTTGLYIPPVAPPKWFSDWLRNRYSGKLRVTWHPPTNRYHVVTLNAHLGEWVPLLVLEGADGRYLPCDIRTRDRIAREIKTFREKKDHDRILADIEERRRRKEEEQDHDVVKQAVLDHRNQLFDIAPPSKKTSAHKQIWPKPKEE